MTEDIDMHPKPQPSGDDAPPESGIPSPPPPEADIVDKPPVAAPQAAP